MFEESSDCNLMVEAGCNSINGTESATTEAIVMRRLHTVSGPEDDLVG
jgi:hypothetical protein